MQALQGCSTCPARSWCAQQALREKPAWGTWAGIWIEDNFADVAHHLAAVAEGRLPTPPRRTSKAVAAKPSVAALITARSSGNCEIMAPDCLLGVDAIASRIPGQLWFELRNPAAGYAVCRHCKAVVQRMERRLARNLGYLVSKRDDPARVPFFWRQSRWMRLDLAGRALACSPAELTA